MVPYYGDFAEDATVRIPLNTFSSDDPAASVTITDLADGDLKVHKDGSVTQLVTDGATVVINFDGITGNHMVTIDTSAHADYSTGSEYAVRMEGTAVDGAVINAWIGSFSIERAGGVLALLKGANSLSDIEGKIDTLDTVADAIKVATDKMVFTVANQLDVNVQYWIDTVVATALETSADVADAVHDEAQADHVAAGSFGIVASEVATILADLANATDGLGALKALIDALNDITAASVMTTQMTESYAADGVAPTPAQSLMMIQQMLTEFAISGTTLTVKKLDGSTTAATHTLDDATSPTSLTRAT